MSTPPTTPPAMAPIGRGGVECDAVSESAVGTVKCDVLLVNAVAEEVGLKEVELREVELKDRVLELAASPISIVIVGRTDTVLVIMHTFIKSREFTSRLYSI